MSGGSGDDALTEGIESNTVEGGETVTVHVRCSNGTKFSVQASLESSVESFKSVLQQNCDIPSGQQRLIYNGRILKDDQTLKSYGRVNQTNTVATNHGETGRSPPAGGLGVPGLEGLFGSTTPDPNSMNQLMQNPAISQMMQSLLSNPQYMNQILGLNPQMRSMLNSNPQLREMMQNPDFIRQLTSPETMQQMMTLQQSLFSGLGQQQTTRDACQTGGGTGAPNNLNLDMLMNMFGGFGAGGFTTPNNPNVPPEELYATQLAQLQEMGFFDTRENLQALTATRGNVHAAVERLLGNLGQ